MKYPVIEISRISTMIKFAYHCFLVKIFFNSNQTPLLSWRFSISFGLFNTKNTRFETSPFTHYFNLTRDHYRIKCDMIQFPNICFLTFPTNCNEGWKKKERERGGGKEGWRDEGREFELNYILISRPFRLRDMPNIRRNLHFKLDTSCHHEARGLAGGFASSGGGGCCRFAVKTSARAPLPWRWRFSKTSNAPLLKKPAEHSLAATEFNVLEYSTYFFAHSFQIYISISEEKIPPPLPDFPFLCYISSSGGPLNYEHHSKSRFHRYERIRPFCLLKCLYRTFFSFPFRASLSILDFLVNEIVTV